MSVTSFTYQHVKSNVCFLVVLSVRVLIKPLSLNYSVANALKADNKFIFNSFSMDLIAFNLKSSKKYLENPNTCHGSR